MQEELQGGMRRWRAELTKNFEPGSDLKPSIKLDVLIIFKLLIINCLTLHDLSFSPIQKRLAIG